MGVGVKKCFATQRLCEDTVFRLMFGLFIEVAPGGIRFACDLKNLKKFFPRCQDETYHCQLPPVLGFSGQIMTMPMTSYQWLFLVPLKGV